MQEQLEIFHPTPAQPELAAVKVAVRAAVNRYSVEHPFPIAPFNSVKIDEFAECLYNELKTNTTL